MPYFTQKRFLKLKSYLFLVGQVAAGTIILVLVQVLKVPMAITTIIFFTAFLLLNLLFARFYNLREAMGEYWSLKKLPYLLGGTATGLLLIIIPIVAAVAVGKQAIHSISIDKPTINSMLLTLLIVGWEELWFRSLLLNYCINYLSKFNVSLIIGLLFVLVHLLNPQMDFVKDGPVLFLAGTLLTALYLHSRNIWLPTGLHFGNNFFGSIIKTDIKNDPFFGNEGYIYVGILLLVTLIVLKQLRKSKES